MTNLLFLALVRSVVMVLMVHHVVVTVDVVLFSRKLTAISVKTKNAIVDFLMKMQNRTRFLVLQPSCGRYGGCCPFFTETNSNIGEDEKCYCGLSHEDAKQNKIPCIATIIS